MNKASSEVPEEIKQGSSNSEGLINKLTLKITDINKEQQYYVYSQSKKRILLIHRTLKLSVVGFTLLFAAHLTDHFTRKEVKWTKSKSFEVSLFAICGVLAAVSLYLVTKIRWIKPSLVMPISTLVTAVLMMIKIQTEADKTLSLSEPFFVFYFTLLIVVAHK
jgi:hypothetical protein